MCGRIMTAECGNKRYACGNKSCALFRDVKEYISKTAKTVGEACLLIEAGFEYVCDMDGF